MAEQQEVYNETLSSRLSQYSIVNSICQGYLSLKEKSPYIRFPLETAENIAQPVLKKLDDALHLDDKGVVILDKLENKAQEITTSASTYYTQGSQFVTHQKDTAIEATQSLITTANRPIHYLLDYTESLLDHMLPPHTETIISNLEIDTDDDSFIESTEIETTTPAVVENPITRIKRITVSVPQRLVNFKNEKLEPLKTETVGYTTELLKYAYETIDVEGKKHLVYEHANVIQKKLEEKRDDVFRLVNPAKEILQKQTEDIKDLSIRALVTTVSAVAHVSEILRRQLIGRVITEDKYYAHLNEITRLTKIAVSKLKEHELQSYIQKFKETSQITIQALIDISYAYTPEKLVPLLTQLSQITHLKPSILQTEQQSNLQQEGNLQQRITEPKQTNN